MQDFPAPTRAPGEGKPSSSESSGYSWLEIRNRWLQAHAQRDSAIDGIDAQRGEEVLVCFADCGIAQHAQAKRVRRSHTLRRARTPLGAPQIYPEKVPGKPQTPPDRASYKLYYVN